MVEQATGAPASPPAPSVAQATGTPLGQAPQAEHGQHASLWVRHDRLLGLSLLVVAFLLALGASYWAREEAQPERSQPPGPPTTDNVKGWPQQVDVLATLASARALTPRNLLRGIVVERAPSSGLLDFSQGAPKARFVFQSPPAHGPQPPRAHGTLPRRSYCGKQAVLLTNVGLQAEEDQAETPCGADHSSGLPEPTCTLQQIWAYAQSKGAPAGVGARIEYYQARVGPAWRFSLEGTAHRFSLAADCKRGLGAAEAAGHVP